MYRRNKELKQKVQLDIPDVHQVYELRHIDDDSDSSCSEGDNHGVYFKPNWELPPLGDEQEIGEFDSLVLVYKRSLRNKIYVPK